MVVANMAVHGPFFQPANVIILGFEVNSPSMHILRLVDRRLALTRAFRRP